MTTKIKVLLVDADEETRRAVSAAAEEAGDMLLLGATDDGEQVPDLVRRLQPDVVVMDLVLRRSDGIEAVQVGGIPDAQLVIEQIRRFPPILSKAHDSPVQCTA